MTPRPEGGPDNTPDDTKHESSRVQHNVEVRVHFTCSQAEAYVDFCSKDSRIHHGTRSIFIVRSGYLHGSVVAARAIVVKSAERGTSTAIPIFATGTSALTTSLPSSTLFIFPGGIHLYCHHHLLYYISTVIYRTSSANY